VLLLGAAAGWGTRLSLAALLDFHFRILTWV
jgi:hypothetical protein